MPPYSDIDLVRIVQETPERKQQKQFLWYDGYLLSLSSRPLSVYQAWLTDPKDAIFRLSGIREAHILLDKDGAFRIFQQEAHNWRWDPLQEAANAYASQIMLELTEIVLKILRAHALHDEVALSEMLIDLLSGVTEAVAVQRGILIPGGNAYFRQIQETIGLDSDWTRYHRQTAGIDINTIASIEKRQCCASVLLGNGSLTTMSLYLVRAAIKTTLESD